MKKFTIMLFLVAFIFSSCSRYVSVEQAANGKARCGRGLR